MALIRGEVNPLNVAGQRRLSFIPDHFAKMKLKSDLPIGDIDAWVYQNLDSRYAIVKNINLDSNNKLVEIQELGVEDPKELTMLSLSCPHLNKST